MSGMGDIISRYMFEIDDSILREALAANLKKSFPGNYSVVFEESPRLNIKIYFKDPEEATLFRIKGWI